MIFLYSVTIDATFEFHGFFFFSTLAECEVFFRIEFHTMQDSFTYKPFNNPIEGCLIHLMGIDKDLLEFS